MRAVKAYRGRMRQISRQEFERLPLRVHDFLAGIRLHDVWAVDLPRVRSGITLQEFLSVGNTRLVSCSPVVRTLVNMRLALGSIFGWDREPAANAWETFASRLTTADLAKTLAPPGRREGMFRMVYRFENEQLLELINRTAHAGALGALVETASAYRFYFGVYVHDVSRFTPIYMALIDPVRKLVVYPSLLRMVRRRWGNAFRANRTMAPSPSHQERAFAPTLRQDLGRPEADRTNICWYSPGSRAEGSRVSENCCARDSARTLGTAVTSDRGTV